MKIKDFLKIYKFNFKQYNIGNKDFIIITELINRSDNEVLKSIKNSIDIYETNRMISDSKALFTFEELDWEVIIDKYKRLQIEQFALGLPIEDFFPLNESSDITILYK